MTGHGFVALAAMKDEKSALAVFQRMDDNGGGVITLVEFCEFIKAAEVAAGTAMGKSLAEDEPGGKPKGAAAKKMGGMLIKANKAGVLEKIADGMEGGGMGGGEGGDLALFTACFEPYTHKTDEAAKLRKKEFRAADRKRCH